MPFTFKISVRLAISHALLLLAAAAACTMPDRRGTGPTPPNVVQVVTSPDTVTLDPYQQRQFQAFGRTDAGDSVAVDVQWSASGGTITPGGQYTADTAAGDFAVTAAMSGTSVTGSSRVKNRGGVAQIIVTPAAASTPAGGTLPFAAFGRRRNGDSVAVSVTWSATGGTISAAGLYTAGQSAGTYRVIATQSAGALADTATVTVTTTAPPPAPVASVTVSPASGSVAVGQTLQLTAVPKDANGNALTGRTVAWASAAPSVATVGGSGLVTGVAAGSASITATSEGQTGSATITVTTAGGGGVVLLREDFEDNAFAGRAWYDNTAMATTTAQHIPGSARALEVHFTAGATTPTWGGAARHLFSASSTLYISYWVKYSANWVGSGHPYHPHEFLVMSDQDGDWDGPSNNWLTLYVEHNYQNGGIPRLQLQDNKAINTSLGALPINLVGVTENRSVGGCNGVVEASVVTTCFNMPPWYNDKELSASQVWFKPTAGTGYKGDWNHVEVYLQMNSVAAGLGVPDGVMQYWFNGTLVIDRHDILFRTGARPTIRFHQFLIGPYIGDGSPVDQYMWIDDLTVATAKP
jgi:hypothetical protein